MRQNGWENNTSIAMLLFLFPFIASVNALDIVDSVGTYSNLASTTVNMSGVSELHITASTAPITGCTINLNSVDSFFFLEQIKPSVVQSTYLSQIRVNGAAAALNTNVRVVEYAAGAVIIPQSSTYQPLQVFTGENFTGSSVNLGQYTAYNTSTLGAMANAISSFILKRGYTATFAQNENGTGYSKNYVAQDCDLEIGVLPTKLDNKINFVRVFPWRWVSKKGVGGNIGSNMNIKWWYNWNLDQNSPLDKEYVPIRQNRWWPDLAGQNWQTRGASHVLGYNEPDKTDQANMAVSDAIWSWPDLLATGLRAGSPVTSDGGLSGWLYPFMQQADTADLRVDFVVVHYYWCYNPANPSGAATQMYNYLKAVHDQTGRPIWITEWNNGANWTGCGDPTFTQQADAIGAMIDMLDSTPWVERYAIYNWVEDVRRVEWDDGSLTDAGVVYRDQVSPVGYQQEVQGSGKSANAIYSFNQNFRDSSGNGNNPLRYGAPKLAAGKYGNALVLDGTDDYLKLPTHMGESADFTFAAWVFWNGGGQWQRIFDFGTGENQYLFLTPRSGDNTLRFAIKNGGGEQRVETTQLAVGIWVHLAVTLSGDTATLYVNGTAAATNPSATVNPSDFNPTNNLIGDSQFGPDPLFNGILDDVIITDYALSGAQITTLLANQQPAEFVAAPLNVVSSTAGSEEAGNPAVNAYDRNRNTRWANDGTVANGWIQYDLGSICNINQVKLKFNVGSTRTFPLRIEIDGAQVFNGNTSMTSGYWKTTFTPTSGRYVKITMTANNSSGNGWFSIWETQIWGPANQRPLFNTNPLIEIDALEGTAYSSWLADNASDPEGGPLVFSKVSGSEWLTVAGDGTLSGMSMNSNVGANVFTVRVTDTGGLYDTAQMNIQVANIYSGAAGLNDLLGFAAQWLTDECTDTPACDGADLDGDADVDLADFSELANYWLVPEDLQLDLKFDETSGTIAVDNSLYFRTGQLVNNPTWSTEGHSGGALSFDGTDDYVNVSGYKGITGTASRTCSAWIKTSELNAGEILSWGSDSPGKKWYIVLSNGTIRIFVHSGNAIGTTRVDNGSWHHVAVVLEDDGSPNANEIKLYIDGVEDSISSSVPYGVDTGTTYDVKIGTWDGVNGGHYKGLIDEVRIYDRALSAVEIAN